MLDGYSFDDLTLAEVDEIQTTVLDGKRIADDGVDPLKIAAGAMFVLTRRSKPEIDFETFRRTITMGELKRFSAPDVDPTNGP